MTCGTDDRRSGSSFAQARSATCRAIAAALLIGAPAACRQPAADSEAAVTQPAFHSQRIAVTTRGAGPDVILVPGLAAGPGVWDDLARRLEGRYRLHLVQLAGFDGLPAGPASDKGVLADTTAEIARYIATAKLDRPALIGHSLGGMVGLTLAGDNPRALSNLMVVDSFPSMAAVMAPGEPDKLRGMAEQQRTAMAAGQPGQASPALVQMVKTMAARPEDQERLLTMAGRSDAARVGDAMREVILADLSGKLPAITAPLKVVYVTPAVPGMTPEKADAAFRQAYGQVAKVSLKRIENAKHYIMLDQPDAFASEVESFLDKTTANPPRP